MLQSRGFGIDFELFSFRARNIKYLFSANVGKCLFRSSISEQEQLCNCISRDTDFNFPIITPLGGGFADQHIYLCQFIASKNHHCYEQLNWLINPSFIGKVTTTWPWGLSAGPLCAMWWLKKMWNRWCQREIMKWWARSDGVDSWGWVNWKCGWVDWWCRGTYWQRRFSSVPGVWCFLWTLHSLLQWLLHPCGWNDPKTPV